MERRFPNRRPPHGVDIPANPLTIMCGRTGVRPYSAGKPHRGNNK